MVALTHLICFLIFRRELLMFWLPFSLWCLCGYFIRIVSMLAGDKMRKNETDEYHPNSERYIFILCCHLPITDRFPQPHAVLSKVFERSSVSCLFDSDDLWTAVVCFQPPSFLIGKIWVPLIDTRLYVSHTLQSALESGQEGRISRLTSAQPLKGSTIREFSISSSLWVLEVLCCLYILTQFQSNRKNKY